MTRGSTRWVWPALAVGAFLPLAEAAADTATKPASAPAPATPASGPLTPREIFGDPRVSSPRLSPSGRYLAFLQRVDDIDSVVVLDLSKPDAAPTGVTFKDKHVSLNWVRWKADDRFVLGVTLLQIWYEDKKRKTVSAWKYGKFMIASDRDGGRQTIMLKSDKTAAQRTGQVMELLDPLKGDPDHILAVADTDGVSSVWRADIHTGAAQMVEKGDGGTIGWDTDSAGAVVGRTEAWGQTLTLQGRAPGETRWTDVVKLKPKTLKTELADFEFLAPGERAATSYVAIAPKDGEPGEYRSLHLYDFKTHTVGPDLAPDLKADVTSIVTSEDTNRLTGVCYVAELQRCEFKDPKVQANMRGLSRFFHDAKTLTLISWTDDARWSLVEATGPDDPGSYFIYDWKDHQVRPLGNRYVDLGPARLGRRTPWSFKSPDAVVIPGYLTYPPNPPAGPLPLVVLPHGGPMSRDKLDFDAWSQLLASHGYLVFQPNFRGSGGMGRTWLQAGYRKWAGLMQDDIFHGVEALIAEGKADKARICVFGASYGGYAALMQGALHPQAYRCVVSWAGVTDIPRLLRSDRGVEGADSYAYRYELKELGDPEADKQKLIDDSPLRFAADYKPPVFLLHGKDDTIVRPDQSQEMEKALKKAGKSVKLLLVDGEGHPNWTLDNQEKAFQQVIAFLDQYIGAAGSASASTASSPPPPTPATAGR